jgi:hypothetical protein
LVVITDVSKELAAPSSESKHLNFGYSLTKLSSIAIRLYQSSRRYIPEKTAQILEMLTVGSIETSATVYQITQRRISKEFNVQGHLVEKFTSVL